MERSNDTAARLLEETNAKLTESLAANADLRKLVNSLQREVKYLEGEKNKAENLLEAFLPPAAIPRAVILEEPVTYNGKKYQILLTGIKIPGAGYRTALEIATEEDLSALAKLIDMKSEAVKEVE